MWCFYGRKGILRVLCCAVLNSATVIKQIEWMNESFHLNICWQTQGGMSFLRFLMWWRTKNVVKMHKWNSRLFCFLFSVDWYMTCFTLEQLRVFNKQLIESSDLITGSCRFTHCTVVGSLSYFTLLRYPTLFGAGSLSGLPLVVCCCSFS